MNINLHPGQSKIVKWLFGADGVRYASAAASRGFGKSFVAASSACIALDRLIKKAPSLPNKNIAIIAPTYSQVVDIYYPLLAYQFGLESAAQKSSSYTGTFQFSNGVTLKLWSADAIERMRGLGQFFVVCDEITTWNSKFLPAWEGVILPTMTTRWPGDHGALIISTPRGYDDFHQVSTYEVLDPRFKHFNFTYKDSPILSAEEIERARKTLDPIQFAREYLASFEESGAQVFYCFDRNTHCKHESFGLSPIEPDQSESVHISLDFNVGVQAGTSWLIRDNEVFGINEFHGAPNTELTAQTIRARYPHNKVLIYPDPSGKARKTSAAVGVTDFTILERYGFTVLAKNSHPPIVDSVAAVNGKLRNSNGDSSVFIDPRHCPRTVKSLERTVWLEGRSDSAIIDKRNGDEHFSDGTRYFFDYKFPITNNRVTSAKSKSWF